MCVGYNGVIPEVKIVNNALWLPNLVIRTLMQVYEDDDFHRGQRSTEVKYNKQCFMATKLRRTTDATLE